MAEYVWSDVYDQACRSFGQTPRAEDEQAVIDAFERNPLLVAKQIKAIAAAMQGGFIKWGWSALAKRVQQAPSRDVVVKDVDDREQRIRRAETWIRNIGHELGEADLRSALFGDEQWTPPLEYLEQIEVETRGRPGRPHYDKLLKAAIETTRREGPQLVPIPPGRLEDMADDQAVRDRLMAVWAQARKLGSSHADTQQGATT